MRKGRRKCRACGKFSEDVKGQPCVNCRLKALYRKMRAKGNREMAQALK